LGGLHHAKTNKASGFCYVNDCVLAIKRLLHTFQKVLYIDIDVHHGDGVESAFYYNPRVLTLSLHQFGDGFFPCTGWVDPEDSDRMKKNPYAINVPLLMGCPDITYIKMFKEVFSKIMEVFNPNAIVL
jgi:histone deacetylase 1/2